MQIKKKNKQLIESALLEAESDPTPESTDPVNEIADDIKEVTDNAVTDAEATTMAAEAKDVGAALGGAEIIPDTPAIEDAKEGDVDDDLNIENKLTTFLQDNLRRTMKNRRLGRGTNSNNILIIGLPGSGKTASFIDWANHATPKVNVTYLNAKNNDLEAFINGYTVRVAGEGDDKVGSVGQAFGHNLDSLDRPNSILFLDEFNRQTKDQIRASLLTLINEHYIMGSGEVRGMTGVRHFPNMLFTVACCNPAASTDKGAAHLNAAETSRFGAQIAYDSMPGETIAYLHKSYTKQADRLNANDPNFKEDLLEVLKTLDFGDYLVSHEDFQYDHKSDLDAIADMQNEDASGREGQLLNQRLITLGLQRCEGDIDAFKKWYHEEILLLPRDVRMLDDIIEYYEVPTDYELVHKWYPKYEDLFTKPADSGNSDEETDDSLFAGVRGQDADNELAGGNADQSIDDIVNEISNWDGVSATNTVDSYFGDTLK